MLTRGILSRGRLLACVVALAMIGAPDLAAAQSCDSLSLESASLNARAAQLIADHPGVHAMVVGCAADAQRVQDRGASNDDTVAEFAICAGVGCLLLGFDNCMDVAKRWFDLSERADTLKAAMRRRGCS